MKLDTDGSLLIDARDTWTTYKVSLTSGNIIWQLGGKDSDFTVQAAPGVFSPHACRVGFDAAWSDRCSAVDRRHARVAVSGRDTQRRGLVDTREIFL